MASLVRIVIVDSDPDSRAALRRILAATPSVAVTGDFSDIPEAIRECQGRHPDIFIAEVPHAKGSTDGWSVAPIEQLARGFPDSVVLATGPSVSVDLVIQVMRAGAAEFLPRPVERADLIAALEKMARMRRTAAPTRRAGRITSVFSTKGGLGVTTLAINLAVCLGEQNPGGPLLVELDTRQSDIATFLDLRATYSVLDAFENLHRMDESFLQGLLVKHGKGLWVLPGPPRMERAQLNAEQVHAGLEMIRAHFEHIVLDLRHDMDPGTIAGLEASDTILFLTSLNVSALRSGAAGLAAFRHLGMDLQKVKIVVMREDTGEDVTLKHAREALGLPIYWKTPSDYQAVVSAINSGHPVVTASPRSKIAKNLRQLAEMLPGGPGAPGEPSGKRSTSLLRLVWTPKGLPGGV